MAQKNPLLVLAACVDKRSGKRFAPGDIFDPVPTVDQATRLAAAGCLDKAAIAVAQKAEDSADADAGKQAAIAAARSAQDKASADLLAAQKQLGAATTDDDKKAAQALVDEATKAKADADAAVASAGK